MGDVVAVFIPIVMFLVVGASTSAWEKVSTFDARGSFGAWLMRIAHNLFLMSHRKSVRDRRLEEDIGPKEIVSLPVGPGRVDSQRVLSTLSEEARTAMVLCYGFGLSHREVADVMGIPIGTIKSHIKRGKARIREQHDEERSSDRRAL